MGNNRQIEQQAIKAVMLREIYSDNLTSQKLQRLQQLNLQRLKIARWMRSGVLVVILLLAGYAALGLYNSAADSSSLAIVNAKFSDKDWRPGLPPLIQDANAEVIEEYVAMAADRTVLFRGTGVFLPEGKASVPEGKIAMADGGFDVGDYQALLEQPEVAIADLFGLGVRTIVIDPGHGGIDPGAIGDNGLMEKDITLKIAQRLYARLADEEGINVVLTRDSDVTMSLKRRVEFARQQDSDLLISIHLNTIPGSPMTVVETYYSGPPTDFQSLQVARVKNHHSEYAVAEFNELITGLSNTLKQQESRKLASHIQKNVYEALRRGNRGIVNVGIKTAPFVILLGAETPSVLAEVTCISNTDEEARLATPAYRDKIAGALEQGILSYLEQLRQQDRQRPEKGSNTYAES